MRKALILAVIIIVIVIIGVLIYQRLGQSKPAQPIIDQNKPNQPKEESMQKPLEEKSIVMVLAFRNFRDAEYFVPREVFESAGANIKTASNKKGIAIGADGGEVKIDLLVSELKPADFDAVVFVGGPGCLKALDNELSYKVVRDTISQGKILGSICISPVILARAGVLRGKKATVWSSPMQREGINILKKNGADYIPKSVVVDGNIVTGSGPKAAKEFAGTIIKLLK